MTTLAIRLGLKQVKGITRAEAEAIVAARRQRPFASLADFCARAPIRRQIAERLILCGALDGLGRERRALLWELDQLLPQRSPAAEAARLDLELENHPAAAIRAPRFPQPTRRELVQWDINTLGLCAHTHPVELFRAALKPYRPLTAARLADLPDGRRVRAAGVVLCRMRPPTRTGTVVVFITLEDETGLVDTVLFPRVYEQYGQAAFASDLLVIEGRLQKQGRRALTLIAEKVFNPLAGLLPDRLDGKTGVARREAVIPPAQDRAAASDEDDPFHPRFPNPYDD